jgi:hypothetical protein
MATEQAVTAVVTTPTPADLADQYADALAGEYDREIDQSRDETKAEALQRERDEVSEVELRRLLADPKRAKGVYTDVAHGTRALTPAQFDVLYQLLKKADVDLTDSFMARKTAAAALQMNLNTYDWHLRALIRHGFVRTQAFRREDGKQSSSGIQFCLPGHVLASGQPWLGPTRWDNRRAGVPKRNQNRGCSGHGQPMTRPVESP